MSHIVNGKLRKAPFIKEGCGAQGNSTMFVIELAEMTKDYQTQEKSYTNYKAMMFAATDAAKAYYHKAFAEGSYVVVQCEKLKVDTFQADSGVTYVTLNMENPRLEGALTVEDQGGMSQQPQQQQYNAPQQQQAPQQQYQQPQQQAQQQYNNPPQGFDDSQIPF
ncbi:nucleic acid-binding, OB-fold protein [Vibrio phage 1.287.O._10N.286.55.C7]|nr:nucleic acid-binding, OB-fold protein [Vibrio phage 1.287.O._10N.286.55.C7]AUS01661.1 nucleic acid-binding, OB-fold protein [Vibrio phage 1.289.A._10N.286.55.E8]